METTTPPAPRATSTDGSGGLDGLSFDNSFMRELPGDPETNNRRRQVHGACWSPVAPTPVSAPRLIAHSREVAEFLGLSEQACTNAEFAEVFAGNRLLPGMRPTAACYGGHQFGSWAGQLGDGRAISLGEVVTDGGGRWELQLKGAGPTPYSRTADGRAVLRSSVREFLCSEAMHHLGVPTTRALSLVTTGDRVVRDMFYDGNPQAETGAVVCRVAPSFLRFGNFEILTARSDLGLLRTLVDYTIRTHYPGIDGGAADAVVRLFDEVCRRTAAMVVEWMRVGFVHGVMNTDNMSVLGLTIDYGPYGWLEGYDPDWTPNTTDAGGRRYRYSWQPRVALWNLQRFAGALLPLVEDVSALEAVLRDGVRSVEDGMQRMMLAKVGLGATDEAIALVEELPGVLQVVETDMTIFFRRLAEVETGGDHDAAGTDERLLAPLFDAFYDPQALGPEQRTKVTGWLRRWAGEANRQGGAPSDRRAKMNAVNPKFVLRNYLSQLAIDKAEEGDVSMVHELLEVLRRPYEEQPGKESFAEKRPEWARHRAGCSMLSCSS
jgi:uncharacterized protein YdiU (UPF0061 family)